MTTGCNSAADTGGVGNQPPTGPLAGILLRFNFERADVRAKDLSLWIAGATAATSAG